MMPTRWQPGSASVASTPGSSTPITGTRKVACSSGSAWAVAVLQATTTALTPRPARNCVSSTAKRRIVSGDFDP